MKSQSPIFTHQTLKLLQKCKTLKTLKQIHAQMITTGLALHTYPLSKLLNTSFTFSPSYSLSIFNQIPNPTTFLYNILISSFSNHKHYLHNAITLYNKILYDNTIKPNSFTYPSLFKAFGSHMLVCHGLALHAHVLKFIGPTFDNFVQASLVNFYAKCGKLPKARYLFNQITRPDLATWNVILNAYGSYGSYVSCEDASVVIEEVLYLFIDMQRSQVRPNEVSLVALIGACANLGAFCEGVWAHAYAVRNNLELNRYVGTALIDMYSRCGYVELAYQLFDELPQRDTLCYNAMIGGFGIHGHGYKALELYENMRHEGLVPDDVTFVVAMCACSHVGLVEEGCRIFESIEEVYGVEQNMEHYCCLVDLLGRAGRLKEAEGRVMSMPMKPNAILWRSLLGAAQVHGNSEIGETALRHLMQLEPETSGNYVLLSNIYASTDRWDDANKVRKLMKNQGIDKMPGTSLVEVDGVVHEFLMDDKRYQRSKEIYVKHEQMN